MRLHLRMARTKARSEALLILGDHSQSGMRIVAMRTRLRLRQLRTDLEERAKRRRLVECDARRRDVVFLQFSREVRRPQRVRNGEVWHQGLGLCRRISERGRRSLRLAAPMRLRQLRRLGLPMRMAGNEAHRAEILGSLGCLGRGSNCQLPIYQSAVMMLLGASRTRSWLPDLKSIAKR